MVWKWPTQTQKHLKYNHWHLQKSQDRSGSTTHYFTSSDPHHCMSRHILSHIFWPIFWHLFWHSICHSFWHLFGILFWHLYCLYWHSIWHSLWHSVVAFSLFGRTTLLRSLRSRSNKKSRNPHLTGGEKKWVTRNIQQTSNKLPKVSTSWGPGRLLQLRLQRGSGVGHVAAIQFQVEALGSRIHQNSQCSHPKIGQLGKINMIFTMNAELMGKSSWCHPKMLGKSLTMGQWWTMIRRLVWSSPIFHGKIWHFIYITYIYILGIASNSNSLGNYTPIFGVYIPQFLL